MIVRILLFTYIISFVAQHDTFSQPALTIPDWVPELYTEQAKLQVQYSAFDAWDSVHFHPQHEYMTIGSTLWHLPSNTEIVNLPGFDRFRFDVTGQHLIGTHLNQNIAAQWDMHTGKPLACYQLVDGQFPQLTHVEYAKPSGWYRPNKDSKIFNREFLKTYSPDSNIYLFVPYQMVLDYDSIETSMLDSMQVIQVKDATSHKLLFSLNTRLMMPIFSFSPDNKLLAVLGSQPENISNLTTLQVWNLEEGKQLIDFRPSISAISKISLYKDLLIINRSIALDLSSRFSGYVLPKLWSAGGQDEKKELEITMLQSPGSMAEVTTWYMEKVEKLNREYEQKKAGVTDENELLRLSSEQYVKLNILQSEFEVNMTRSSVNSALNNPAFMNQIELPENLGISHEQLGELIQNQQNPILLEKILQPRQKLPDGIVHYSPPNSNHTYLFTWSRSDWHVWQQNITSYDSLYTQTDHDNTIHQIVVDEEHELAVSISIGSAHAPSCEVFVWDLKGLLDYSSPKLVQSLSIPGYISEAKLMDSGDALLALLNNQVIELNLKTGKVTREINHGKQSFNQLVYSPEYKQALLYNAQNIALVDLKTWRLKQETKVEGIILNGFYHGKTPCFLLNNGILAKLNPLDISKRELIPTGVDNLITSSCHPGQDYLAFGDSLGEVFFFDLQTNEVAFKLILSQNQKDWLIFTPENYYMHSRRQAMVSVKMVINGKGYGYEQFDLMYNRPDKVLLASPFLDDTQVEAFEAAYKKRIERMGINQAQPPTEVSMPKVSVKNAAELVQTANQRVVVLDCEVSIPMNDDLIVQISSNNVPIYQEKVSINEGQAANLKIPIKLAHGPNKLEVWAVNSQGVASLRETIQTKYVSDKHAPELYVLAIGVSDYKDLTKELKFAAIDAQDIAHQYKQSAAFSKVHSLTLTNQEATRERILDAQEWLNRSRVDDQVIIFISGHGLLDENYNFYYATHDIDFANPAERGILYDDIESLLDGIPSQKRLLLIDACHSGEYDANTQPLTPAQQDSLKAKGIAYKGFSKSGDETPPVLGLQNSFEMMQQLFADLRRGSGATVISSSSGMQFSYEDSEWQNGAFTYVFLRGLKTMEADADGDGEITGSEIQAYVAEFVPRLTEGLQVPTFRRENLEFDFRVW